MRLRTLLGDHPGTKALKDGSIKSDLVTLDFVGYSPTNKGFKPMVLLPNVVLARFQHAYALYNARSGTWKPTDLNGKRGSAGQIEAGNALARLGGKRL